MNQMNQMNQKKTATPPAVHQPLVLAIDQGTTGSTVALFSPDPATGEMKSIAHSTQEFRQIYPTPGWVEHDPEDIWNSVLSALSNTLALAAQRGYVDAAKSIAAIGITNQRETIVCFERKSGLPLGNAIVWQDRRTAAHCDSIKADPGWADQIRVRTGLVVDPYFSATKIKWLLQNNSEIKNAIQSQHAVFGTIDSYLCCRLTAGESFVTEPSNASRTMLVNLETGDYDTELLGYFGIPKSALPPIMDSIGNFGTTKDVPGLPDGIPITGILGDQQAALFGQRAFSSGQAKITFGTGCFILMHTGTQIVRPSIQSGLLTTIASRINGRTSYCVEGACFIAGAAIQFLRDQLTFFGSSADCEKLALRDPADESVQFVPSLAGLSAPFWNPYAKGVLFGLSRGTSKSQITRAVLESIALQNVPLLLEMQNASNIKLEWIGVDGGAAANGTLMQLQADLIQSDLRKPANLEATATGAALAAWSHLEPKVMHASDCRDIEHIKPKMTQNEAQKAYRNWLKAVQAVDAYYKADTDNPKQSES
jgi:glycerol kinase